MTQLKKYLLMVLMAVCGLIILQTAINIVSKVLVLGVCIVVIVAAATQLND